MPRPPVLCCVLSCRQMASIGAAFPTAVCVWVGALYPSCQCMSPVFRCQVQNPCPITNDVTGEPEAIIAHDYKGRYWVTSKGSINTYDFLFISSDRVKQLVSGHGWSVCMGCEMRQSNICINASFDACCSSSCALDPKALGQPTADSCCFVVSATGGELLHEAAPRLPLPSCSALPL